MIKGESTILEYELTEEVQGRTGDTSFYVELSWCCSSWDTAIKMSLKQRSLCAYKIIGQHLIPLMWIRANPTPLPGGRVVPHYPIPIEFKDILLHTLNELIHTYETYVEDT